MEEAKLRQIAQWMIQSTLDRLDATYQGDLSEVYATAEWMTEKLFGGTWKNGYYYCPLPREKCIDSWHVDCRMEFALYGCAFEDASNEQLQNAIPKLKQWISECDADFRLHDMLAAVNDKLAGRDWRVEWETRQTRQAERRKSLEHPVEGDDSPF